MTKEAIIKAWKFGHSKEYIISNHYDDIKHQPQLKEMSAKRKKWIAQNEVELALLENYRKEMR